MSKALASICFAAFVLALAGCGGQQPESSTEPSAAAPAAETAAEPTTEEREAQLAAREKEIELREKEQALDRREAALPGKPTAASHAPAASSASAAKPTAPPAVVVQVPAGTSISVELATALSTKTTTVGEPIEGHLASDIVVDGQRVAAAGAQVRGTVTSVESAKKKIGGKAKLEISFDSLELVNGAVASIAATALEAGKSNTAQDAAKIGGATAAGAILGHQVDGDKGKVIGGIVGGAIGTVVAANTGTELELPAGTVLAVQIQNAVEVRLPG